MSAKVTSLPLPWGQSCPSQAAFSPLPFTDEADSPFLVWLHVLGGQRQCCLSAPSTLTPSIWRCSGKFLNEHLQAFPLTFSLVSPLYYIFLSKSYPFLRTQLLFDLVRGACYGHLDLDHLWQSVPLSVVALCEQLVRRSPCCLPLLTSS